MPQSFSYLKITIPRSWLGSYQMPVFTNEKASEYQWLQNSKISNPNHKIPKNKNPLNENAKRSFFQIFQSKIKWTLMCYWSIFFNHSVPKSSLVNVPPFTSHKLHLAPPIIHLFKYRKISKVTEHCHPKKRKWRVTIK